MSDDALRQPKNQRIAPTTGPVVRCCSLQEVEAAVQWAGHRGMRLSARSGGHCYEGSSVRQELVLDLSGLNHFEWLTDERVCVGSGWTLGQLRPLLQARGRTTIFGSCPSVGLGGFVLGGGFGFLSRSYGLALDLLRRAELVNAEGQGMWVDSDHHPDLSWAIRGGPTGGFGVVTRLELETRPLPEGPVTVFNWRWPLQAAPELSQAWFRWIADAPDELATCLILNGGQAACVASVIGLWLGPGRSLPAWPGRPPLHHHEREMSFTDAQLRFDYPGSHRWRARSDFWQSAPSPDQVQRWVERLSDQAPLAVTLQFDAWGGAVSRQAQQATAFPHRSARALMQTLLEWTGPEHDPTSRQWLLEFTPQLATAAGGAYQNYRDDLREGAATAYFAEHLERLRELKAAYDPAGRFGDLMEDSSLQRLR